MTGTFARSTTGNTVEESAYVVTCRKITSTSARRNSRPATYARSGLSTGDTHIFTTPGIAFQVGDLLVTNVHLPKSTLLMLESAIA